MWNLSVVLCVLLFGSAANSMDVDEEHSNDGLDKINDYRISIEANKIMKEITKEISTFMEKAKLIHTNLVQITTNVEDAGVNDWSIHVMNFIHTNGNQLVSNVEECIAKDVTSLRRLFNYCEYLRVHSGVKDKDKDVVDDSFYEEAGNTETDVKRGKIKERIYFDAIMTFGTDKFEPENMMDMIKQLLRCCQAEERGTFYTATIPYLISREHYIQKKIEGVHNLPRVPKEPTAGSSRTTSGVKPSERVPDANPNELQIKTLSEEEILSIAKKCEREPTCMVRGIMIEILGTEQLSLMSATSIRKFSTIPPAAIDYVKKIVDTYAENEYSHIKYMSTLNSLCAEIRKQNKEKITVVSDFSKTECQIEYLLNADPTLVVEKCNGNARCMVRCLMIKIFGKEQLINMGITTLHGRIKIPIRMLDLVEQFINEKAADKLTHMDYIICVSRLCSNLRYARNTKMH